MSKLFNFFIDFSIPLNNYSKDIICPYTESVNLYITINDDVLELVNILKQNIKKPGLVTIDKKIVYGLFSAQQDLKTFKKLLFTYKLNIKEIK